MPREAWDPDRELVTLRERVNRLFEERTNPEVGSWEPAVDVYQTEPAVVLEAELPGVFLDSVEISCRDRQVVLKGERPFRERLEGAGVQRLERSYGPFQRSFPLPEDAVPERREVSMENGVLRVIIPRART